ncbi:16S rRNA (guanine(527)-N(7))-methyltransferase RsmG [Rhodoplanes sp. Z2-YC6860]|uniref:16S rRNA (guanine(527)-N(7))-methyltransferase RsmG n=1 Tax=Rhodoplanes sp. Z2-YC6860 TaxID=674703 RepID=UPI00078DC365|nr:16S rRNA (guanine(527)-N(7))-methyltransferase RsmG [Rhodoplanes sp. Z2-YC6860]AMN38703.1 Glucose inhibited division protein B [Rhodoplanes sp. Z2-YC6860]
MSERARSEISASDLAADRDAALRLTPVSRETSERLDSFVELLLRWSTHTNLIARSTLPAVWTRHIADSLQLLPLATEARCWIDLGSGAGFPGLVIACALADEPGAKVHLVESIGKKAAFLREVAEQLQLPAVIHPVRIEDFGKNLQFKPDVVTARALAPLDELFKLAQPLLRTGALGLFPKGQDVEAELTKASKSWNIEASLVPSKTNPSSRIIAVTKLRRRSEKS